jgi:hypothetical protein
MWLWNSLKSNCFCCYALAVFSPQTHSYNVAPLFLENDSCITFNITQDWFSPSNNVVADVPSCSYATELHMMLFSTYTLPLIYVPTQLSLQVVFPHHPIASHSYASRYTIVIANMYIIMRLQIKQLEEQIHEAINYFQFIQNEIPQPCISPYTSSTLLKPKKTCKPFL